jgi:SET domain-containing protein
MIERRKSKIHGWGVYSTQVIPKNTRIIDYAGEKISNQVSLKRELRYLKTGHIWCFKLTNRTVIDAGVGGNLARFINHRPPPATCRSSRRDLIVPRERSDRQELTYHYNTDGEAPSSAAAAPR